MVIQNQLRLKKRTKSDKPESGRRWRCDGHELGQCDEQRLAAEALEAKLSASAEPLTETQATDVDR